MNSPADSISIYTEFFCYFQRLIVDIYAERLSCSKGLGNLHNLKIDRTRPQYQDIISDFHLSPVNSMNSYSNSIKKSRFFKGYV